MRTQNSEQSKQAHIDKAKNLTVRRTFPIFVIALRHSFWRVGWIRRYESILNVPKKQHLIGAVVSGNRAAGYLIQSKHLPGPKFVTCKNVRALDLAALGKVVCEKKNI